MENSISNPNEAKLSQLTIKNDKNSDINIDSNLTKDEVIIQLKFYNSINITSNRFKSKPIRYKLSSLDINQSDIDSLNTNGSDGCVEDFKDSNLTEIAVMNGNECQFRGQEPNGRLYDPNEFVIFRTKFEAIEHMVFLIDLYLSENDPNVDQIKIGFCYVFVSDLKDTIGIVRTPFIRNDGKLIAQLNVEYLIINGFKGEEKPNTLVRTKSWEKRSKGYDIGHRGAGMARRTDRIENVLENTIASFNFASRHGADMVELDVQLSKDKIPIVYHDYDVNIAMKNKKLNEQSEYFQLAIKELTYKQLQMLELSPVIKANKSKYDFGNDDKEENTPFASLQRVLELVDPRCGFNVEIKYPQQKITGHWEAEKSFELNEYVDIILTALFNYSNYRNIILSCFHPDICSLLKLKQNRYPVLFLTQGKTTKWLEFKDPRNKSIEMAAYFAQSMQLDGINVHAEDIIHDRDLINFVKARNLILFCWGEDLNQTELIDQLKKEGVDGVVYDKIDELSGKANSGLIYINQDTMGAQS